MFTLKHVVKNLDDPKASYTSLHEVTSVTQSLRATYVPEKDSLGNDKPLAEDENGLQIPTDWVPTLYGTMPDGATLAIDNGLVFVMNAAGKTVDTVRLRGSEWF